MKTLVDYKLLNELTANQLLVLSLFCELCPNGETKRIPCRLIEEITNLGQMTIVRIVNHLNDNGYIEREKIRNEEYPCDNTHSVTVNYDKISNVVKRYND